MNIVVLRSILVLDITLKNEAQSLLGTLKYKICSSMNVHEIMLNIHCVIHNPRKQ
jgi:hypothetical protein